LAFVGLSFSAATSSVTLVPFAAANASQGLQPMEHWMILPLASSRGLKLLKSALAPTPHLTQLHSECFSRFAAGGRGAVLSAEQLSGNTSAAHRLDRLGGMGVGKELLMWDAISSRELLEPTGGMNTQNVRARWDEVLQPIRRDEQCFSQLEPIGGMNT